jgi:hypothetical protein
LRLARCVLFDTTGKSACSFYQNSSQPHPVKIFPFRFSEKCGSLPPSCFHRRGDRATATDVGSRMRWTRSGGLAAPRFADGEGVWSCPPDAGVKSALRSRGRATEANKPGTPGRARYRPKSTIAQGMPDCLGCPVLPACAKCTFLCTPSSRVRPASGIPCALPASRATTLTNTRADPAAGTRRCAWRCSRTTKAKGRPKAAVSCKSGVWS